MIQKRGLQHLKMLQMYGLTPDLWNVLTLENDVIQVTCSN